MVKLRKIFIFTLSLTLCSCGGTPGKLASLAEKAKSYVGYVHAVAHSLGGRYNTPHGLANAVLLPHVLKAYGPAVHKKLANIAICIGIADENTPEEDASNAFIEAICNMQKVLNIPEYIDGIVEDDIPKLARYAEKEANPLYPVPKLMDAKELEKLYYTVI